MLWVPFLQQFLFGRRNILLSSVYLKACMLMAAADFPTFVKLIFYFFSCITQSYQIQCNHEKKPSQLPPPDFLWKKSEMRQHAIKYPNDNTVVFSTGRVNQENLCVLMRSCVLCFVFCAYTKKKKKFTKICYCCLAILYSLRALLLIKLQQLNNQFIDSKKSLFSLIHAECPR